VSCEIGGHEGQKQDDVPPVAAVHIQPVRPDDIYIYIWKALYSTVIVT
jgi:hypothetical protein